MYKKCVQCGKRLKTGIAIPKQLEVVICDNPECPDFGLLQIGIKADD